MSLAAGEERGWASLSRERETLGLTLENGGRGPVGTPCSTVSTSGVALTGAGVLG